MVGTVGWLRCLSLLSCSNRPFHDVISLAASCVVCRTAPQYSPCTPAVEFKCYIYGRCVPHVFWAQFFFLSEVALCRSVLMHCELKDMRPLDVPKHDQGLLSVASVNWLIMAVCSSYSEFLRSMLQMSACYISLHGDNNHLAHNLHNDADGTNQLRVLFGFYSCL